MINKLVKWVRAHRFETVIFCCSVGLHLLVSLFLFHRFGGNVLYFENEDAYSYINLAKNIAAGVGFMRDNMPSAIRTPGLPIVFSVVYLLHLPETWGILILQNVIASLTVVMVYRAGRKFFSERTGKIAAIIYLLEPYMLMTANLGTTETLFNLVIIGGVYWWGRWYMGQVGLKAAAVAGCLFGVATLIRPIGLYLPVLLLMLTFVQYCFRAKSAQTIVLGWGIATAVFLATLFPWSLRQQLVFHTWRITNIDASMLYFRTAPLVIAEQQHLPYPDAILALKQELREHFPGFTEEDLTNNFAYYPYMMQRSRQLIMSNLGLVLRFYSVSLGPTLFGTGYEYIATNVFGLLEPTARASFTDLLVHHKFGTVLGELFHVNIVRGLLLAGIALWLGIYTVIAYALFHRDTWRTHGWVIICLLFIIGYFVLFAAGPASHARYRMPTFPFWFLLLGYSLDFLITRAYNRRTTKITYGTNFNSHPSIQ